MAPKQAAGRVSRAKPAVKRPARQAAPPKSSGKETISSPGKPPVTFTKGGLHKSLGVPPDQPIPAGKMASALAGKAGPKAKQQAQFARNMLAKGRQTAASNRKKG